MKTVTHQKIRAAVLLWHLSTLQVCIFQWGGEVGKR